MVRPNNNNYLVAPVQVIFPEDHKLAVVCGFRSFMLTIYKWQSQTNISTDGQ